MSFSGIPEGSKKSNPIKASNIVLEGFGFWPDLALAEFQNIYRVPAEYREELVLDHLEIARLWVMQQLASWCRGKIDEGYACLQDIPVNGQPDGALKLFKRAVFCHAKAILLEQFATLERRESAKNDAKEGYDNMAGFYAQANRAISDILDKPRILAELI